MNTTFRTLFIAGLISLALAACERQTESRTEVVVAEKDTEAEESMAVELQSDEGSFSFKQENN